MLKDLKILDFTRLLPGPYASWMLGEMGAKVLKVQVPDKEDLVLSMGPKARSGITANSAWLLNNSREIAINLKEKSGVSEILRLIDEEEYNCIFEQFRPGVMDKIGLGYEFIKKEFPHLIYASLTGYGQRGPLSTRAGHDINYLSLSGLMSYWGKQEEGPSLASLQVADLGAAQNAVIGILAAHSNRKNTGQGCHVDIGILDSVIPFNAMAGVGALMSGADPKREEDWLNGGSCYDFYETSDGGFISVGALEPKFWKEFCETMGHTEWIKKGCVCDDFREKKQLLKAQFKEKPQTYWEGVFAKKDCCVEGVKNIQEALVESESSKARGFFKESTRAESKEESIKVYSNPIKFSY